MAKKKEEEGAQSVLDRACSEIKKKWGVESIHIPGEELHITKEVLSTGIPPLDGILGNNGIVKGTITEIFGLEGSGKSTLCLQIIAQAQKQGMKTLFIDQEQALDPGYAEDIGADVGQMYITQPDSMEMALGILEQLVRTGEVGLVIVDSMASLVPQVELDMEVGQQGMGIQPKKMSEWLRRFNPVIANTDTIVIFTNQLRDKLGGYGGKTTPGGRALKFYASYRLEVKIKGKITDSKGNVIGNDIEIVTVKNKKAMPYQKAEMKLVFGTGVDITEVLIDDAIDLGLIGKAGNWHKLLVEGEAEPQQFNGRAALKTYLVDNPEVLETLRKEVETLSYGVF